MLDGIAMKKLTDADETLIHEVIGRAFEIADSSSGDFTISISKQDIRENTGRRVVRDVVLNSYSEKLASVYDTTARVVGDKIIVNIPSHSSLSQYSLSELRKESEEIRNQEDE